MSGTTMKAPMMSTPGRATQLQPWIWRRTLTWNNADGTWDCPCHGSVFAQDGRVLHGPARDSLPPVEI